MQDSLILDDTEKQHQILLDKYNHLKELELGYQEKIRDLQQALSGGQSNIVEELKEQSRQLMTELQQSATKWTKQIEELTRENNQLKHENQCFEQEFSQALEILMDRADIDGRANELLTEYEELKAELSEECLKLKNIIDKIESKAMNSFPALNQCKLIMVKPAPMFLRVCVLFSSKYLKCWNYSSDLSRWISPHFQAHALLHFIMSLHSPCPQRLSFQSQTFIHIPFLLERYWKMRLSYQLMGRR